MLTLYVLPEPAVPPRQRATVDQRLDMLAADLRDLSTVAGQAVDLEFFARRVDLIREQLRQEAAANG